MSGLLTDDGDVVGTQDTDEPAADGDDESADAEEVAELDDDEDDESDESDGEDTDDVDDDVDESDEDEDGDEGDRESGEDDPETPEKQGLRLADYTRKTQAVAEQKKQLEAAQAEVSKRREEYEGLLTQTKELLEKFGPREPTAEEWDTLKQKDPNAFALRYAEYQQHKDNLAKVEAEQERVRQEALEERQEALKAHLKQESERLVQAIPEWEDQKVAAEEKAELIQYLQDTYGYGDDDLRGVTDHRLLVMARKAQKFDALSTKGKAKLEAGRKAAPVMQPGGRKPAGKKSGRKALRAKQQKLARSGSMEDATAVIMGMIDD